MSEAWHETKKEKPIQGAPLIILQTNGYRDKDAWTTDVAYFCDGEFYKLDYDEHLGVLRKQHVTDPVEYWTQYVAPSRDSIVI